MTKLKFLLSLNEKLSGLPRDEVEERLNFYSEMIEDRMEEGLSEEEAVSAVGSVEEIAEQIISEIPLTKIATEKIKPKRRLKGWEICLLILGAPLWLSLVIGAVSVLFSLYVVLWSVIISLWAAAVSVIGGSVGGIVSGIIFACQGKSLIGLAMIGAGIVLAGVSIFLIYGCGATTKAILYLTKKIALWIKKCFIKKEEL